MGIYLNKAKSKVIMPMSAEEEIKRYPKDFERMQGGGLVVLGAPVGTKEFVQEFIDDKITKVEVLLEKIKTLENPQVIGALIKQCVQGPKLAHLMRTTTPKIPRINGKGTMRSLKAYWSIWWGHPSSRRNGKWPLCEKMKVVWA